MSPPRRSVRAGIRLRFTLWVSAVSLAAVGLTFAIVYQDTGNRLRKQISHDLTGDTAQLAQSMQLLRGRFATGVLAGARSYVGAEPFRSISTLLFVLVPGTGAVSNHPEVFASEQKAEDGETPAAQARENRMGAQLRTPRLGFSTHDVPDVGAVRLLERRISLGPTTVVVGAGEPLISVTRAQRGVVQSFLLATLFIALAVLLGSYLVGTRVTAPLRRMARVAARVDAGDLEPRMDVSERRRDEVGVLAIAFNHMLQRLEEAFRGQREFIADASHELRTPLTVIQGQLEVLANRRDPDRDEIQRVERLVRAEIQRMRRLVDDLLVLAQSDRLDFLALESIPVRRFITQLWDGVTLIADRRFELGDVPAGTLHADPDRLAQAIRNLVNNAIDHTAESTGVVRLEVSTAPGDRLRIAVLDDGPGIPPAELERIFERFHRTGASRATAGGGAGLGLAIVRAIATAHGGSVRAVNRDPRAAGNRDPGAADRDPVAAGTRDRRVADRDGSRGARFEIEIPGFRTPRGDTVGSDVTNPNTDRRTSAGTPTINETKSIEIVRNTIEGDQRTSTTVTRGDTT